MSNKIKLIISAIILLLFIWLAFTTTSCEDLGCGGSSGSGQYGSDPGTYFP
jgi:hypothetical protein